MKVSIDTIRIGKRIRREIGDLTNLKSSIEKYGLLNPIIITSKNELISGYRRLMAAKELGWEEIEAKVMDPKREIDFLEMEMHENIVRKDFTIEELDSALEIKRKLLSPNIFVRIWRFIKKLFGFQ